MMERRYHTAPVPASALARTTDQLESSRSGASPCARSPTCVFQSSAGRASKLDSRSVTFWDWLESAFAIWAASSADCARAARAKTKKKTRKKAEEAAAERPHSAKRRQVNTLHRT